MLCSCPCYHHLFSKYVFFNTWSNYSFFWMIPSTYLNDTQYARKMSIFNYIIKSYSKKPFQRKTQQAKPFWANYSDSLQNLKMNSLSNFIINPLFTNLVIQFSPDYFYQNFKLWIQYYFEISSNLEILNSGKKPDILKNSYLLLSTSYPRS